MLKKHIPNTITCLNLISGCIATYFAFQSDYGMALLFIIIGAVFDFFDGLVARLLHVSSPIGKELDSLADCITFGFAPSAIVFAFLSPLTSHISPLNITAFLDAGEREWQIQTITQLPATITCRPRGGFVYVIKDKN